MIRQLFGTISGNHSSQPPLILLSIFTQEIRFVHYRNCWSGQSSCTLDISDPDRLHKMATPRREFLMELALPSGHPNDSGWLELLAHYIIAFGGDIAIPFLAVDQANPPPEPASQPASQPASSGPPQATTNNGTIIQSRSPPTTAGYAGFSPQPESYISANAMHNNSASNNGTPNGPTGAHRRGRASLSSSGGESQAPGSNNDSWNGKSNGPGDAHGDGCSSVPRDSDGLQRPVQISPAQTSYSKDLHRNLVDNHSRNRPQTPLHGAPALAAAHGNPRSLQPPTP